MLNRCRRDAIISDSESVAKCLPTQILTEQLRWAHNQLMSYLPSTHTERHSWLANVWVDGTVADEAIRIEHIRIRVCHRVSQDGPTASVNPMTSKSDIIDLPGILGRIHR